MGGGEEKVGRYHTGGEEGGRNVDSYQKLSPLFLSRDTPVEKIL